MTGSDGDAIAETGAEPGLIPPQLLGPDANPFDEFRSIEGRRQVLERQDRLDRTGGGQCVPEAVVVDADNDRAKPLSTVVPVAPEEQAREGTQAPGIRSVGNAQHADSTERR